MRCACETGGPHLPSDTVCMEVHCILPDQGESADSVAKASRFNDLAHLMMVRHTSIHAALSVGTISPLTDSPHLTLTKANMRKRVALACNMANPIGTGCLYSAIPYNMPHYHCYAKSKPAQRSLMHWCEPSPKGEVGPRCNLLWSWAQTRQSLDSIITLHQHTIDPPSNHTHGISRPPICGGR
jgi:hypothetical protein